MKQEERSRLEARLSELQQELLDAEARKAVGEVAYALGYVEVLKAEVQRLRDILE